MSTAPHLHLHVADRNALLGANGLPYVFTSYRVTGKAASSAAFYNAEATGKSVPRTLVRRGIRRRALPLDLLIAAWL